MKKILLIPFLFIFIFVFFITNVSSVFAQTEIHDFSEEYIESSENKNEGDLSEALLPYSIPLKAVAGNDKNVIVNRQVLFNADRSTGPHLQMDYTWNFGDGTSTNGIEVSHTYKNTGVYRVTLTIEDIDGNIDQDEIIVTVSKDIIVLISDNSVSKEDILKLQSYASSQGILIVSIKSELSGADYVVEKQLTKQILDEDEDIKQSKTIIFWTLGNQGINAFIDAYKLSSSENQTLFSNKLFVNVLSSTYSSAIRISKTVFQSLNPSYIIVTPKEGLEYVVSTIDVNLLLNELKKNDISYDLIGIHSVRDLEKIRVTNFLSVAVNYLVNSGVPIHNVYMILILPIIATLIAIARQVVGIKTFGIYTPTIITLAFLSTGLVYGLILFSIIVIIGTLVRVLGKRLRFLYIPRIAVLLSIVSLSILLTYIIGMSLGNKHLIDISILPILLLIVLIENFVAAQMEKGSKEAVMLTLHTLGLSIVCYLLVNWYLFKDILIVYPEIIFLSILINVLLGRWTGLRILEYYRFNKLFSETDQEEE